jgi:hypothetical protein
LPDIFLCKRLGKNFDMNRRTRRNFFLIAYLNMEEIPSLLRPMSMNGI